MTFIPLARIARVPAVVLLVWAIVAIAAPPAMARYAPFSLGRGAGLGCQLQQVAGSFNTARPLDCSRALTDVYQMPLPELIADATLRSLALLGGAAILGLVLGTVIGVSIGLLPLSIARVHVLPHAWPVVVEALGSGLRISVASLPIVEYLFVWNGIGFLALQAIASRDPVALAASAIVLGALFSFLGALSDLVKARS